MEGHIKHLNLKTNSMKNLFFLFLLGPFLFSQNFQTKDSLKILAKSNFKSMEVFEVKNERLIPLRNYTYDKNKNEITIKNSSDKNKEWLRTIIKFDNNYNITDVEKTTEGMVISEKENSLVKKQISVITKYFYNNNTVEINEYNDKGHLSLKQFKLFDDKNRIIEQIRLFNIPDDIVVSEIEKYNWIDNNSYNYEKLTFHAPKSRLTGVYKLNQYGDRESFRGNIYLNGMPEDASFDFDKKIKKFDSKGNLIQVYKIDKKIQTLIEERKIIY